jgi:glutaminase
MAATVANKGKNPVTKKVAIDEDLASTVGSVMMTCGMYDGAGNWMVSEAQSRFVTVTDCC